MIPTDAHPAPRSAPAPSPALVPPPAVLVPPPAADAPPVRVLVVDDEPAHVEAIRRAFDQTEPSVGVLVAGTLAECRSLAAATPPDIALIDLNLPDGRAVDLLVAAGAAPPAFPVLVMTSHGNEQTAVEALKAGAVDYVVKSAEAFARMPGTVARALRETRLIDARRRAEQLLREREQEVVRLNGALEQRVAERTVQLESAVHELEGFAYSVSHDLRAPLRAIEGFAAILAQDYHERLDAEGHRLIGVVRSNARRMDALISGLLDFSRLTRRQLHPAWIDMDRLAREVFEELATPQDRKEVAFSTAGLPVAWADPVLVRQVWTHLIANALKYTRALPARRIAVEGSREGAMATYRVRDSGVGFDQAYAARLFGAFERLHLAEQFEGTGIGLAIVKRIVQRHGGQVRAEGSPGAGASLEFSLPASHTDVFAGSDGQPRRAFP